MPIETNAAPAGAGEGASASVSAVAEMIAGNEEREAQAPATSEAPDTTAEAEQGTADETVVDETAGTETSKPEIEGEPTDQIAHGNMLVRLRDGSTRRVGDLKKLVDLEPDLTRRSSELETVKQQFATKQAEIAQQGQFFSRVVPYALQILRQSVPPEPDATLLQTDPFAHYEQTTKRTAAMAQVKQLEAAAAVHQQQTNAQMAEQRRAHLAQQQQALLDRFPDLKTPAKMTAFRDGIHEVATRYGFTPAEIDATADHRVVHLVHDLASKARAYEALMAKKPVADKKPAPSTSVQVPGRRATSQDAASQNRAGLLQRAKTGGGQLRDVAALIAADEKD